MTVKFHQTKEFQAVNSEWQKKLKQSGFDDIEYDEDHLKTWHSFRAAHEEEHGGRAAIWEIKAEYYRLAGQFLNSHRFASKTELRIWKLHSEGISFRNIAKQVSTRRKTYNKDSISHLIRRLSQEMLKLAQEDKL